MRKINRGGSVAAPTPATPVPAAAPITPEVLPPAVTADTPTAALALASDPTFAAVGSFERAPAMLPAESGGYAPELCFYHGNSTHDDAQTAFNGSLAVGSPFLKVDGQFFDGKGLSFLLIREFSYWCTVDASANWVVKDVYLNPLTPADPDVHRNNADRTVSSSFGVTMKGIPIKERVLSIALILPTEGSPLPEPLQPALCTLTEFRQACASAPREHTDAVEATIKGDTAHAWANANGPLVNMPPRFRIASTIRSGGKSGKKGAYPWARAKSAPMSVQQLAALENWWTNKDCVEEREQIEEAYDRKVAELMKKAKG